MIFKSPFQPKLLYDFIILWFYYAMQLSIGYHYIKIFSRSYSRLVWGLLQKNLYLLQEVNSKIQFYCVNKYESCGWEEAEQQSKGTVSIYSNLKRIKVSNFLYFYTNIYHTYEQKRWSVILWKILWWPDWTRSQNMLSSKAVTRFIVSSS